MRDVIRTQWLCLALAAGTVNACGAGEADVDTVAGRWYTQAQVEQGRALYRTHCASCHGDRARGLTEDWRKTDANGNYPPPPLNDGDVRATIAYLQRLWSDDIYGRWREIDGR